MARTVITLSETWTQISAVACSLHPVTLNKRVHVNESSSDVAALQKVQTDDMLIVQNEAKDTYVRKDAGETQDVFIILDET